MIALEDEGNTDIDGFSDINPNNYKIATVNSTGRTYAEHDNSSTSNIFNVRWTAPIAGTGSVTFYAAGNAVNNNGQNTGDGASYSNFKLVEGSASSTQNPDAENLGLRIWPNPIATEANISAVLPQAGDYRVAVYDLSGRLVWKNAYTLPAGENRLEVSATKWGAGVYFVNFSGNGISANIKVAKF